jgi:shikimate dehydrogenase
VVTAARRFGVLGWPVAHSRSPAMHRAAYEALGLDGWRYQLLPVPPELFDETTRALPGAGFSGANVTIPHKEAALALADEMTPAAEQIGAANTLTFEDGVIHADNTDAPGFLASLPEMPGTALVLGAGGSAKAVVWALLQQGVDTAVLARTRARAEGLGARVVDALEPADLLVNCTPLGLHDASETPVEDPRDWPTVVDLVYRGGGGTRLIRDAGRNGAATVDGLEILVQQGALSLERWTGRGAPLDAMRRAARSRS